MDRGIGPHNSGLLVSKTPMRLSFAGGGTDLREFYKREAGAVFSTAINKYVYVTVKHHGELFGEPIRLSYSGTELVQRIDEIENSIARECLRFLDIDPPIFISVVSDIPASTGLGSSSSFAVGLLNVLHAYSGERVSAGQLAQEAAHVEMDILGRPIGKQDHYSAAFGGFNCFRFMPDDTVTVEPQWLPDAVLEDMFGHIMLFWTGITRDAGAVLSEQRDNTAENMSELLAMGRHAIQLKNLVSNGFDPEEFGRVLDSTWQIKRELASTITSDQIDGWYRSARDAGALGGKLCGAGGGGFLLLIVPPARHDAVRQALSDIKQESVRCEMQGSRLILPLM